jgi:hypothetical protein
VRQLKSESPGAVGAFLLWTHFEMKSLVFVMIAAALLGGLFLGLRPAAVEVAPAPAPASASASAAAAAAPAPVPEAPRPSAFEFVVKDGKVASGEPVIKARQGDEITLVITSDKADELHLHGYDRHAHLQPNAAARVTLKADRTGRFPIELHKSHIELGTIEVYPKP